MRQFLILTMAFAMTFTFVELNFADTADSIVEFGIQDAEARSRSSSRSSSSSRSRPSAPIRKATPRPTARPAPQAAKSTATSSATARPAARSATQAGSKPVVNKQAAGATAAAKQQSKARGVGSTAKPTIKTSSGKSIKVAGTPAAKSVRGMSSSQYSTRGARRDTAFNSQAGMRTPAQRTTVINNYGGSRYGDGMSGLFMYSLLSMSLHDQSRFHYNRWDSYSHQRQQQLMMENAALKAEMAGMAGQPRNPNYVPAGTDPDLALSNDFVNAAYNPAPVVEEKGLSFFGVLLWVLIIGGAGTLLWSVFGRRTKAI